MKIKLIPSEREKKKAAQNAKCSLQITNQKLDLQRIDIIKET